MAQRDRSATKTTAGHGAQALVEQRLEELRALAASEHGGAPRAGGITTGRAGESAATDHAASVDSSAPGGARDVDLGPMPAVQFDTSTAATTPRPAGATLRVVHPTPTAHPAPVAMPPAAPAAAAAPAAPVEPVAAPEPAVPTAVAPAPTALPAATTSGAQAAAISASIEQAIARVEHSLQRDAAQIAATLQTWGSPARAAGDLGDQLGAALQRMEHALRTDLARVAQSAAVAAEGASAPQQVIEAVAQWSQRADASLEQRLGGVHAQLLQFDARLRDLVEPVQGVASGSAIAADLVPTLAALQSSIVELGGGLAGVRAGVEAGFDELAVELGAIDATLVDRVLGDDAAPLDTQLTDAVAHVDASLTAAVAQVDARVEQVIAAATATAAAGIARHVDDSAATTQQAIDSSAAALAQHVDIQVTQLAETLASLDANTSADGTVVAGFRWQLDALRTSVDARFDQLTDLVASTAAAAAVAQPVIEEGAVDEIRASLRQIELRTAPVNDRLHDLAELLRSLDQKAGTGQSPELAASIERIGATLEDTTRIEGIAASVQHLGEQLDSGLHGLVGEQLDAVVTALQARIASEGDDARADVRAMVSELAAVLEAANEADGRPVNADRLTSLLGTALEAHHADLAKDLRDLESTLLAAQDDVPEELTERVTGAIDGLQAQLEQHAGAWDTSNAATRTQITDSLGAMHESLGNDLATARTALQDDMAELQRRMVGELDYNRLQHVRDVETIIDAMTSGWTAMFQRLQVGDERIARLEQRLETWIDAIDADADAD